jgi:lipoyl(octanoyl) transferase
MIRPSVELIRSENVEYSLALTKMNELYQEVSVRDKFGYLWLLEHDDVFTIGRSGSEDDILDKSVVPIIHTDRGGKVTYHGKGQRIIYPILNLNKFDDLKDIKKYVRKLESWIIKTLSDIGIKAKADPNKIGIWTDELRSKKIASIGIKIKKWISLHGIAINFSTNLDHFRKIVPCGLESDEICSINSLGCNVSLSDFDKILLENFIKEFVVTVQIDD